MNWQENRKIGGGSISVRLLDYGERYVRFMMGLLVETKSKAGSAVEIKFQNNEEGESFSGWLLFQISLSSVNRTNQFLRPEQVIHYQSSKNNVTNEKLSFHDVDLNGTNLEH